MKPKGNQNEVKVALGTLPELPWAPKGQRRVTQGLSNNILGAFWVPFGTPQNPLGSFGGSKESRFGEKTARAQRFYVFFAEKVSTCVSRFWDICSSVLGSPDPHHSMVFTMYYALPHFSGKCEK